MKTSNPLVKLGVILALVLVFLIPIGMIKSLISDRQLNQQEAIESITEPIGGEAEIEGLVIAVPYNIYEQKTTADGTIRREVTATKYMIFAPDSYNLDFSVKTKYLNRGIFKVPVFDGEVTVNAQFNKFDYSYFNIVPEDIVKEDAVFILGFSSMKNLNSQPKLNVNGKELSSSRIKDDSISPFKITFYFKLSDADIDLNNALKLTGNIDFKGANNIKITPIATDNRITMNSNWPDPKFDGGFLPKERNITKEGFTASWEIPGFNTVYNKKSWLSENRISPDAINASSVNVDFIITVDAYKKTERSVKYAILFLLIPFMALFISEIISKIRIHPVQYCLIGLADVIFYLLLLSISEHISFDLTYWICSICVSLSTLFYAAAIFKKIKWGGMLSAVQFVSYIFLFVILQSESYALLMGSIGLFVAVVLLMFITRKVDWYELGGMNLIKSASNAQDKTSGKGNTQEESKITSAWLDLQEKNKSSATTKDEKPDKPEQDLPK